MGNLVKYSYRVVWDGLSAYEARQSFFDDEGKAHGCSGLDYFLKEVLCNGVNFSKNGEAVARKILHMDDSPTSTSSYDAENNHPLTGKTRLETRCYNQGQLYICNQGEIGVGRCPTKKSDADGSRTYLRGCERTIYKVNNTEYFCFISLSRSPELYLSVIPKESILQLWNDGKGDLAPWKNCRINEDITEAPVFERRPIIRLSFPMSKLFQWFYGGKSFNEIEWVNSNPYDISIHRQNENIQKFNNQRGYNIKFPKSSQKKISIDERIRNEGLVYKVSPDAVEVGRNGEEIIDIFNIES